MKLVKRTLVGIAIFLLLILQIGLFLPHDFRYERSVWIKATPSTLFPYINDLSRWEEWTVWNQKSDPTYTSSIQGKPKGEGAQIRWASQKNGTGTIEIMLNIENRLITYDKFLDKDGFKSNGKIELIEMDGGTKVIWAEEGDFGYNIIGRYLGILMDNFLGKDLEACLLNLKKMAE